MSSSNQKGLLPAWANNVQNSQIAIDATSAVANSGWMIGRAWEGATLLAVDGGSKVAFTASYIQR
jgi:hypothetical protein